MKEPSIFAQIFGLFIRCVGVLAAAYGVRYLAYVAMAPHFEFGSQSDEYMQAGLCHLGFGVVLMRFAPILVRFAYPCESPKEETQQSEPEHP